MAEALGIIEKDTNNDVLWVWCYPTFSTEEETRLLSKCGLHSSLSLVTYRYHHFAKKWYYLHSMDVCEGDALTGIRTFVIVLKADDYYPEKYEALSRLHCRVYARTASPPSLLKLHLQVQVSGECIHDDCGAFSTQNFGKIAICDAPVKELIKLFGPETILIYTALMVKRRVVVYHHKADVVLHLAKAVAVLVSHRASWSDAFYPLMDLSLDVETLQSLTHFVAGFHDPAVEAHRNMYDLFVNLAAAEITVSPGAKSTFHMSKAHKDIAMFLVRLAEQDDITDVEVIREIHTKTHHIINSLKNLATPSKNILTSNGGPPQSPLSRVSLKGQQLSPALEVFYWNIAIAEGLVNP